MPTEDHEFQSIPSNNEKPQNKQGDSSKIIKFTNTDSIKTEKIIKSVKPTQKQLNDERFYIEYLNVDFRNHCLHVIDTVDSHTPIASMEVIESMLSPPEGSTRSYPERFAAIAKLGKYEITIDMLSRDSEESFLIDSPDVDDTTRKLYNTNDRFRKTIGNVTYVFLAYTLKHDGCNALDNDTLMKMFSS